MWSFLEGSSRRKSKWLHQGIYEYNHKHCVYAKKNVDRIKEIEKELDDHPENTINIGNDIRQYFEVLLHQLAMLLMSGAKEETTFIIKEICQKSDFRFFHIDASGISDLRTLFKEINDIMRHAPEAMQWRRLRRLSISSIMPQNQLINYQKIYRQCLYIKSSSSSIFSWTWRSS